ncbi:hypothetical protein A3L25_024345 [Pseudomonas putida]|uniref:Uncharacterized protein n=1 Tax=Pseudomonas putida TaxID=303 RepID=A0AAP9SR01_PSEPU|nr:hypothetical protein [Pseudomonas putida]QJQ12379.1 hypothetical protein A3L25_024345 [Pseudomonas putida]
MTSIVCPANSRLTPEQLTTLSMVFTRPARAQLIELRNILNDYRATFRTYKAGEVTFDMEGLAQRVLAKCPAKTLDRLNQLLDQGLCLQAIAGTPLRIPLSGPEGISLTT